MQKNRIVGMYESTGAHDQRVYMWKLIDPKERNLIIEGVI